MSFNLQTIKNAKIGFESKCLFILVEGYRRMKEAKRYAAHWEEETITAQLIDFIENCPNTNKWRIHIEPEGRIYDTEIIEGDKSPKKAARIDMKMLSWQSKNIDTYFIEAKNLCENDWTKPNNSKVSASYQLNRYVNKGVSHFVNGYYPSNGCLCGYILLGDNEKIVEKLNRILIQKSYNTLKIAEPINSYKSVYKLDHTLELINIFLDYKF